MRSVRPSVTMNGRRVMSCWFRVRWSRLIWRWKMRIPPKKIRLTPRQVIRMKKVRKPIQDLKVGEAMTLSPTRVIVKTEYGIDEYDPTEKEEDAQTMA